MVLHEHSPHCVFDGALQHRPGARKGLSTVVGAGPALLSPKGHQPFLGSALLLHRAGITLGNTVIKINFRNPSLLPLIYPSYHKNAGK